MACRSAAATSVVPARGAGTTAAWSAERPLQKEVYENRGQHRDWAARHGQPVTLTLTGPAGGALASGQRGTDLQLDAIEFCRIVSGRAAGTGLLSCPVPF
jgi:hypothetical protein